MSKTGFQNIHLSRFWYKIGIKKFIGNLVISYSSQHSGDYLVEGFCKDFMVMFL